MAFGIETIDWQAPWLRPYCTLGQALAQQVGLGQSVAQALNHRSPGYRGDGQDAGASALPVHFVSQSLLPADQAYEWFIHQTGQCPTRDGLHDFFNGLVWHHLPRTKRLLNRMQADAIGAQGIGAVRGPLRDALTLFDENAALLACPDALWQALQERQWETLFVTHRDLWKKARIVVFGHALLEKLVHPRKGMCAHVLRVPRPFDDLAQLDDQLEGLLTPQGLQTKPFQPLPVLGVPGWSADNADPAFYQDSAVFRGASVHGQRPMRQG